MVQDLLEICCNCEKEDSKKGMQGFKISRKYDDSFIILENFRIKHFFYV